MQKNFSKTELIPFSITARTALLLGRENISSPVIAVLELVKNAYDADARKVTIRFKKASSPNGVIEISDDGHGMSHEDILSKWMVIGTNNKQKSPISPGGRIKVGEKGIGRFALDRLASETILETTPQYEPDQPSYKIKINWDGFIASDKSLHEILQPLEKIDRRKQQGTRLILRNLRDRWSRTDYEQLYRNLVVLIPPFQKSLEGFRINFVCDEAPSISGIIRSPMTETALFRMRAYLEGSNAKIVITTRDNSQDGKFRLFKRYTRTWDQLFDPQEKLDPSPSCGDLEFEFYFYLRDSSGVKGTIISLNQLREYLDLYGGVRIYRDGFRVKPYGDPGGEGDWLGLSARRVKHPAGVRSKKEGKWVVAENQVAAAVFITRSRNPGLQDQTNREGLFNNQAFRDLRAFVLKCIEIFETDRRQYELEKLPLEKPSVESTIEETKQELSKAIDEIKEIVDRQVTGTQKEVVLEVLNQLQENQANSLEKLQDTYELELEEIVTKEQLLQNAATVGIAVSAMGHESLETSRKITEVIGRLRKRIKDLQLFADERIQELTGRIERYGYTMYSISNFALGHVDRSKRIRQKVNPNTIIEALFNETLYELCQTNMADIVFISGEVPEISIFPYEIESIVINFVTNSLAAFRRGHIPTSNRKIEIETICDPSNRFINIISRDSGPGIPPGDKNRIFEIYSTKVDDDGKPLGTGLGLVIVKDIVENHKGTISVKENGSILPGAEFVVSLPIPQ